MILSRFCAYGNVRDSVARIASSESEKLNESLPASPNTELLPITELEMVCNHLTPIFISICLKSFKLNGKASKVSTVLFISALVITHPPKPPDLLMEFCCGLTYTNSKSKVHIF